VFSGFPQALIDSPVSPLSSREFCDQQGVADGDLVFQEALCHRRNQVGQLDPAVLCCVLIYVVSRASFDK
jgi:hypothetical protein